MSTTDDPRGPGPAVPPADELDELASALHDREGTTEETARAAEPDVAARMAAFARVTDAVAEPVPPLEDAARDRAIAAALAAWGTAPTATDDATEDRSAVDDVAHRRQRRAALVRPLGIAAAILAAIAVGGVALRSDRGDTDEMANDAAAESSAASDGDAGAGAARDDTATAMPALVNLGAFTTVGELAAAFDRDRASRAATPGADTGTGGAGDDDSAGTDEGEESAPSAPLGSVFAANGCVAPDGTVDGPVLATLAERPVVAYVVDDGSEQRVVVLDQADCSPVGEHPSG